MSKLRLICCFYVLALFGAASLNYIPGLADAQGRTFGIFQLDIYDDGLHFVSGVWALAAALISRRAARFFLLYFGAIYLGDGLLGLATGSGYLDLGIFNYGVVQLPLGFKAMANFPHLFLGSVAVASGLLFRREVR